MGNEEHNIQDLITEYVLGLMDAQSLAAFEARLANDSELASQVAALRRVLQPLNSWETPEPEPALVDTILARVQHTTPLEFVASSASIQPESVVAPIRRSNFSLGQLVAIAACLLFMATVFVPGVSTLRSRRLQANCGQNMASFYRGLYQYSAANDGYLPNDGTMAGRNWLHQPNRSHMAPAIRLRFIIPKDMICPANGGNEIDTEEVIKNIEKFVKNNQLRFYSTQNMNGPVPRINARIAMPLAADANPMFENGQFRPLNKRELNSQAHGGRGQNVLFMDGSTKFLATPVFEERDNIWQAGGVEEYTGTEIQESPTDAFLIP